MCPLRGACFHRFVQMTPSSCLHFQKSAVNNVELQILAWKPAFGGGYMGQLLFHPSGWASRELRNTYCMRWPLNILWRSGNRRKLRNWNWIRTCECIEISRNVCMQVVSTLLCVTFPKYFWHLAGHMAMYEAWIIYTYKSCVDHIRAKGRRHPDPYIMNHGNKVKVKFTILH